MYFTGYQEIQVAILRVHHEFVLLHVGHSFSCSNHSKASMLFRVLTFSSSMKWKCYGTSSSMKLGRGCKSNAGLRPVSLSSRNSKLCSLNFYQLTWRMVRVGLSDRLEKQSSLLHIGNVPSVGWKHALQISQVTLGVNHCLSTDRVRHLDSKNGAQY